VSLYWLCYKHNGKVEVVIQPGQQLMFARVGAGIAGLDEGTFVEGHPLDEKMSKRVPKEMIGRRLAKKEAARLLDRIGRRR